MWVEDEAFPRGVFAQFGKLTFGSRFYSKTTAMSNDFAV
jgi:hypothetical protein